MLPLSWALSTNYDQQSNRLTWQRTSSKTTIAISKYPIIISYILKKDTLATYYKLKNCCFLIGPGLDNVIKLHSDSMDFELKGADIKMCCIMILLHPWNILCKNSFVNALFYHALFLKIFRINSLIQVM